MIDAILSVTFIVSIFTFCLWSALALLAERKEKPSPNLSVSVIIPAHDEEKCIESTVKSVIDSDYGYEVEALVVDDGSCDRTYEIVSEMARKDRRVKIIRTDHLGKALAVNEGVRNSSSEVVVLLDADSSLMPDALSKLVAPFEEGKVGAVSGIIGVFVNRNILTWFQEFEYVLSSMWRYIFDKIECTYVLPGFCALRRTYLEDVGLFETDTLSEDFDIGLKMHKAGYKVLMSKALMKTNVPQSLKGLMGQRFRWGRGTVQVLRKHKDMILNPRYGFIGLYGLPNQIYFFVQSFFIVPITFYQIFGGYMRWYVANDQIITLGVLKYFFSSFSMYGTLEFTHKTLAGIWPMSWIFPLFLASYVLNMFYSFLAVVRVSKVNIRLPFVLFFLFPYYLLTLIFFIYPLLLEVNPATRMSGHINVWEKNR